MRITREDGSFELHIERDDLSEHVWNKMLIDLKLPKNTMNEVWHIKIQAGHTIVIKQDRNGMAMENI